MARAAATILLTASLLLGATVRAESAPVPSPLLAYAQRFFRLELASGRLLVMNSSRHGGMSRRTSASQGREEELSIQASNVTGASSLSYELATPQYVLSIRLGTEGRVRIDRRPKGASKDSAVEFLQEPGKPMSFGVGGGPRWEAPTLWHLLLAHPEECQAHLLPYLQWFFAEEDLMAAASQLETELLRAARDDRPPDRKRWAGLVAELAAPQFGRREAAAEELRQVGPRGGHYLRRLDPKTLDAEQRFRIRRIIQAFSTSTGKESVREAASTLIEDPTVWLVLLERPSVTTRRTAAAQLEQWLGQPIEFDPEAPDAARAAAIESLRRQVESAEH